MSGSTSIPWKRIVAESIAIVASILLAFAIDAWWATRLNLAEERELIAALHGDFVRNDQELASALDHHRRIYDAAGIVLDSGPDDCAADLKEAIQIAVWQWRTFNQTSGALGSLLASGRLGLIQDPELRSTLAAWGGLVEDLIEDEARTLERRDVLAEYVALEHPDENCSELVRDSTFKALLRMRRFEEFEVIDANGAVSTSLSQILDATDTGVRQR